MVPKSYDKIRAKQATIIAVLLAILALTISYFGYGWLTQFFALGVILGGIYAVAAIPFAWIYGVMRFFNLAHGELIIVGAYVSYWLFVIAQIDPFVSLPLSFAFLAAVGFIYYKVIVSRIRKVGVNPTLVASFGLAFALQGLMLLICRADPRAILTPYSKVGISIGPVVLPLIRVIVLLVAVTIMILLRYFLMRTFFGRACRAVSQDWEVSEMIGINSERIYMLSFILCSGLAGIAGTLIGMAYSFEPTIGLRAYLLKSIAITVLGGVGSIGGIIAGGIVLGLAEVFGALFLGGGYRDAIAFIILILAISFKPTGLFGKVAHL
jgi:branched-chain amino acid transport system permease protein